jgi:hypothetical protein
MSSISSKMTQKLNISGTLDRAEYSFMRYGQIAIYLFAIAVITSSFFFIQKIIISYLNNLALGQLPDF